MLVCLLPVAEGQTSLLFFLRVPVSPMIIDDADLSILLGDQEIDDSSNDAEQ